MLFLSVIFYLCLKYNLRIMFSNIQIDISYLYFTALFIHFISIWYKLNNSLRKSLKTIFCYLSFPFSNFCLLTVANVYNHHRLQISDHIMSQRCGIYVCKGFVCHIMPYYFGLDQVILEHLKCT